MGSATDYVYDHVSQSVLMEDMAFSDDAPRPGDRLPDFDLPSTHGDRVRTADYRGRKPVLIITGSYSCPMTKSSNPILKELYAEYGSSIEFIMLHVREAHPGEHREQPRSFREKLEHAQALQHRDHLPWLIAVDDPEGSVHHRFDEKPNAVYLADRNGVIVYRGLWAGDEKGLVQALDSVARGQVPEQKESQRRFTPMAMGMGEMRAMTRQSGPRAERDLWHSAPPMALMALIADYYRPLPPKWRTIAAAATIGVTVSALVAAALRARRH